VERKLGLRIQNDLIILALLIGEDRNRFLIEKYVQIEAGLKRRKWMIG